MVNGSFSYIGRWRIPGVALESALPSIPVGQDVVGVLREHDGQRGVLVQLAEPGRLQGLGQLRVPHLLDLLDEPLRPRPWGHLLDRRSGLFVELGEVEGV